ncbi:MAG: hypothetical protein BWX86_01485 [Verrucomicrobia bacterium ADurb.Bin122]|nr:MAG: hypothetical protein BWX86_01485 [Verrucomicrobia bacterium ADurb.Bin122]
MFEAGDHAVGPAVIVALETAHGGRGDEAAEIGILAIALGDAAPARVTRDVDHRRKRPIDADDGGFEGGHRAETLDERGVPRAGEAERDRVRGAETVDRIEAEDERDAEARLLDGEALQAVAQIGIGRHAEEGAELAGGDEGGVLFVARIGHQLLQELADAFLARHAGEQVGDAGLGGQGGVLVGVFDAVFIEVDPAAVVHLGFPEGEGTTAGDDGRCDIGVFRRREDGARTNG